MKRWFDLVFSFIGLIICIPILLPVIVTIWLQDFHSPFYIAKRIGKDLKPFKMIKLRTMVVDADKLGIDSSSSSDSRLTLFGKIVRKYKIDELIQLWNVLKGDMSFVGPRPNVEREVKIYTHEEIHLLNVKPGITDISSIVFSDLGEIIQKHVDYNLAYNQLVRPWKSRLGLLYVEKRSLILDIKLIFLTVIAVISKTRALKSINKILIKLNADPKLIEVALREKELTPYPPPGGDEIVTER